jgi:hypothetical protein
MSAGRKLYVVVRRTWKAGSERPNWDDYVPVRAFTTRKAAETHCRELEGAVRRETDVWTLFGGSVCDEDSTALREAGLRLGLLDPKVDDPPWDWWENLTAPVTEAQRVALWEAIPNPEWTVYRVTETKLIS